MFLLNGGAVSWLSKKQPVVVLSTSEAEYIALSSAAQEAIWLHRLLNDFRNTHNRVTIMEDNQGALALLKNPVFYSRTKHINIHYHFI